MGSGEGVVGYQRSGVGMAVLVGTFQGKGEELGIWTDAASQPLNSVFQSVQTRRPAPEHKQ